MTLVYFLKIKIKSLLFWRLLNCFLMPHGLSVNHSKSEIMAVHSLDDMYISGIQVKQVVRYLGIIIRKSASERITIHFSQRLQKTSNNFSNNFNCWLQGNVSIQGRVLISKAEGISRLVYPALSLYVDSNMCSKIDKMLFKFIWRGKTEYVKIKNNN